jgi:integration host factor subunit beta
VRANDQAVPVIPGGCVRSYDTPVVVPPRRALLNAPPPACGFRESTCFRIARQELPPGSSHALSSFERFSLRPCPVSRFAVTGPGLPLTDDAERILNAILGQIVDALARRDRVEIRGFGAFSVRARQARVGHNPRSRSTVSIPEKVFPWFRPSKEMHKRLNPGSGNSA